MNINDKLTQNGLPVIDLEEGLGYLNDIAGESTPRSTRKPFKIPVIQKLGRAVAALMFLGGVAATSANAYYTLLGTDQIQSAYSINDNPNTDGIDIETTLEWINASSSGAGTDQITANGDFGAASGLTGITNTYDFPHMVFLPTYEIGEDSFNITYASGVTNPSGQSDFFKFSFELPSIYNNAPLDNDLAEEIIGELNGLQSGSVQLADAKYSTVGHINGTVVGDGIINDPFSNSPLVYIFDQQSVPEPATLSILAIGGLMAMRKKRRKDEVAKCRLL